MTSPDTAPLRAPRAIALPTALQDVRAAVAAHTTLAMTVLLTALAALMYGPSIADDGFYYDDWAFLAAMGDRHSHSWFSLFQACRSYDNGDRPGACVYHTTMQWLFGNDAHLYHLVAVITLIVTAVLLFVLLRRCRCPPWLAAATAALFVVFPGSDSTRLWPTANNLSWALALYLGGILVGLAALQRRGRKAVALHLLSIAMLLLVLLTYDGLIPVVAMSGVFFYLARRDRAALLLGVVDLVLAAGYGVWRLKFAGIDPTEQLTVGRSPSQLAARQGQLLRGGWHTVKPLFLPHGSIGVVVAIGTLAIVALAILLRPRSRGTVAVWLAVAAGCVVFAAVSLTAYITANPYYTPDPFSLFNRLNIAAAPAYCLGFVALLAALTIAVRALLPDRLTQWRGLAVVLTVALAAVVVVSQYDFSRATQRSYTRSREAQAVAIRGIRRAVVAIPPGTSPTIVTFGHPLWEPRFISVFSAYWELRGAIDEETSVDPKAASPFLPGWGCAPTGISDGTTVWATYTGASPLWFIDATTGRAYHVTSAADCQDALKHVTPLPFFDPAGS